MVTRLWELDGVHKTCLVSPTVDTFDLIILFYFLKKSFSSMMGRTGVSIM